MDIGAMMKIKGAWETFIRNHPKFPGFLNAAKNMGIKEGTIIGISIRDPEGNPLECNIKVTESDLQLFETIKKMSEK